MGYIKEYDNYDNLKFKGNYINGWREWKGKDYDYGGNSEYEGEYRNGKRDEIGKEYYKGNLIFEGKYLYGSRWNGKVYDNKNNII